MRAAIFGFLATALLVALDVTPPPEALQGASQADRAFAQRHAGESDSELRKELGLQVR